jgi:hypothetical protein
MIRINCTGLFEYDQNYKMLIGIIIRKIAVLRGITRMKPPLENNCTQTSAILGSIQQEAKRNKQTKKERTKAASSNIYLGFLIAPLQIYHAPSTTVPPPLKTKQAHSTGLPP